MEHGKDDVQRVPGAYSPTALPAELLLVPGKEICPPNSVNENKKTEKSARNLEKCK